MNTNCYFCNNAMKIYASPPYTLTCHNHLVPVIHNYYPICGKDDLDSISFKFIIKNIKYEVSLAIQDLIFLKKGEIEIGMITKYLSPYTKIMQLKMPSDFSPEMVKDFVIKILKLKAFL